MMLKIGSIIEQFTLSHEECMSCGKSAADKCGVSFSFESSDESCASSSASSTFLSRLRAPTVSELARK